MDLSPAPRRAFIAALVGAGLYAAGLAGAQGRFVVMASTTSTEQSGLFAHLLPLFKQASGIDVRVVALGTGQALDTGRRGDADLVFVHDTVAEEKFVADGFARRRLPVMYNDFVLIGPAADPAQARGRDIAAGLGRLATAGAAFVSRGDKSGTHAAEGRLWKLAGIDLAAARPAGRSTTAPAAAAWGRRSTWRRAATPMCWPTAAPGWRSGTGPTWRCWSRAKACPSSRFTWGWRDGLTSITV